MNVHLRVPAELQQAGGEGLVMHCLALRATHLGCQQLDVKEDLAQVMWFGKSIDKVTVVNHEPTVVLVRTRGWLRIPGLVKMYQLCARIDICHGMPPLTARSYPLFMPRVTQRPHLCMAVLGWYLHRLFT